MLHTMSMDSLGAVHPCNGVAPKVHFPVDLKLSTKKKKVFLIYRLSPSVVSYSLQPHRLQPARLLYPWDSQGKNTGLGCHVLLQGIFLTQELNLHLLRFLHWQVGSLSLVPHGKPNIQKIIFKNEFFAPTSLSLSLQNLHPP